MLAKLRELGRRLAFDAQRRGLTYRVISASEWRQVETLLGYYQKPKPKISPISFAEIARQTGVSDGTVGKIAAGCRILPPPKKGAGRKKGSKDGQPRTRKSKFRDGVIFVVKLHPDWNNQQIAEELGTHRETVRLIRAKLKQESATVEGHKKITS